MSNNDSYFKNPDDPIENGGYDSIGLNLQAWLKPPDTVGVQTGCEFLKEFKEAKDIDLTKIDNKRITAFSILSRLHDRGEEYKGRELCYEYVRNKNGYSDEEAGIIDTEIETALSRGPAKCIQVRTQCAPDACAKCPYNGKVTSPVNIEGEYFARTKFTGFWFVKENKDGTLSTTKPDFYGLAKEFRRLHDFVTITDSGSIYIYKDYHWQLFDDIAVKGFIQSKMSPQPSEAQRKEFLSLLKAENHRHRDWFSDSIEGLINMQNGVYSIEEEKIVPHDKKYGFQYVLPYDFDPLAECPQFSKFMVDICQNKIDLMDILQEYLGYAIAGGNCYAEKALFLYGPKASNGKSTLVDTLYKLVGKGNYSSITVESLNKDTKRYMLEGKLFNVSEETNVRALAESEVFKTMVTGGELDVKKLYVQDYSIRNKAKLIVLCNELPRSGDRTDGLYRRMIIFPMDAKFSKDLGNRIANMRELLATELAGIFNFCVEGYRRLKKNEWEFSQSETVDALLEAYKVENDNVLSWMNERLETAHGEDQYEAKDDIYLNYRNFCEDSGVKPLSKNWFFRSLYLIRNFEERKKPKRNGTMGSERTMVILGIKLLA